MDREELKRPQMYSLADAAPIKKVVRRDGQGNIELCMTLNGKDNWHYWFRETEINTRRGCIRWVHHLATKKWITGQHIRQLIDTSFDIINKKMV